VRVALACLQQHLVRLQAAWREIEFDTKEAVVTLDLEQVWNDDLAFLESLSCKIELFLAASGEPFIDLRTAIKAFAECCGGHSGEVELEFRECGIAAESVRVSVLGWALALTIGTT